MVRKCKRERVLVNFTAYVRNGKEVRDATEAEVRARLPEYAQRQMFKAWDGIYGTVLKDNHRLVTSRSGRAKVHGVTLVVL